MSDSGGFAAFCEVFSVLPVSFSLRASVTVDVIEVRCPSESECSGAAVSFSSGAVVTPAASSDVPDSVTIVISGWLSTEGMDGDFSRG